MRTLKPATSPDRFRRVRVALPWIGLAVGWTVMLVLVNPRGEFPLNDDWSYARAVKTLHDGGRLAFPVDWASMTLIAQVGWGWLVTSLFGFSFFALRLGTLIPAAAGIAGGYALLREARASKTVALLAAATIAFSPWYAQLSLSFMTDVPFLTATIWSCVFLLRSLKGTRRDFWIGLGLSLVATMIRQQGIFIAIAWALTYLWRSKGPVGRRPFTAIIPLVVNTAYLAFHDLALGPVLGTHSTVLELHHWGSLIGDEGWGAAASEMGLRLMAIVIYGGVMSLPLWVYSLLTGTMRLSRGALFVAAAAILIPLLWRPYVPRPFDIVYSFGLGPPTLRDVYLLGLPNLPSAPRSLWVAFTAAGLFGGVILLGRWIQRLGGIWREREPGGALMLVTLFSLGCLALVPLTPFLDRHLLLLVPLFLVLAAPRETDVPVHAKGGIVAGLTIIFATAAFTTAGLHDYFAWNRARWTALEWLNTTQHVTAEQVDGGFEYNGWNTFDANYHPQTSKSWWWVKDDEYLVSFGTVPGYTEYATFAYAAWLPPGRRAILVLSRTTSPEIRN